jgi:hypothetical protein
LACVHGRLDQVRQRDRAQVPRGGVGHEEAEMLEAPRLPALSEREQEPSPMPQHTASP